MIKAKKLTNAIVVFVTVLLAAACSKDAGESGPLASADTLLAFVPPDSPYVIAHLEPLPDELLDKLEPKVDEVLRAYQTFVSAGFKAGMAQADPDEVDEEELARIEAIAAELSSLMSVEGLRGAGLSRDATAVFYGNGLLPVLRLRLSDSALIEAAMRRLEEKAGEKLPVASLGDVNYRYVDAHDVKIIIATVGNDFVLTMAPSAFTDDQLARLVGVKPLTDNMASAGTLQALADEHGFTDHYAGFVNVQSIVGSVLGDVRGLDVDLLDLLPADRPQPSAVCKAEMIELAGLVPRVVFGYTEVATNRMAANVVVSLRDDIAAGLAKLPAPVPGLGGDKGALLSFGMSIDALGARNFYEERLDAVEANPYECPEFAPMQQSVEAGRKALEQQVPPMVYDFQGFLAVIEELEGMDLATNTPPTSIDGRFLLAMKNAPNLLALGAMFSPELAALDIEPDGKPARFESSRLQGVVQAAWIAMTDNAIALAVGEDQEARLSDMLDAPVSKDGTFMSFSMDVSRYYAFIGEAVKLAAEEGDGPMPKEMQQAVSDLMAGSSKFYDRLAVDVRLTGRGVEIGTSILIQD